MIKEYIYLKVPEKWKVVYDALLIKMAELGTDLLVECNASCKGVDKEYIACWNMFQAACAAYELKEFKKADTLIKFITTKLNIDIDDYKPLCIYYGTSDTFDINDFEEEVVKENGKYNADIHKLLSIIDNTLIINQDKHYHYIIVPDKVTFIEGKYGIPGFETIINYQTYDVVINDIEHKLYLYYSPVGGFDEKVILKFTTA